MQQQRALIQQQRFVQQRFDWSAYRPFRRPPLWAQYRANFNPQPFEWVRYAPRQYVVRYVPPPGWYYHRWYYGQVLPVAYWSQPYWLTNYQEYGLEPLPYGYVWVQYGPDAMAVDTVTGTILRVLYNLFSTPGLGTG
jgi:Ni/Co efflux regulator RcnB